MIEKYFKTIKRKVNSHIVFNEIVFESTFCFRFEDAKIEIEQC